MSTSCPSIATGGCPSGGGGGETKSPKERYNLIFLKHFSRAKKPVFYITRILFSAGTGNIFYYPFPWLYRNSYDN